MQASIPLSALERWTSTTGNDNTAVGGAAAFIE